VYPAPVPPPVFYPHQPFYPPPLPPPPMDDWFSWQLMPKGEKSSGFGVIYGLRGSSWTSWTYSLLLLLHYVAFGYFVLNSLCWTYCIACLSRLHELVCLNLNFACNMWWTILACKTPYPYDRFNVLVVLWGCVNDIELKSYIILYTCVPRFPLVGETPSKISNSYIWALGFHLNLYAHIKGEFSLLIELRWNLSISYSENFKKNGQVLPKFKSKSTLCLAYKIDLNSCITS
jgi:hypothetical protein